MLTCGKPTPAVSLLIHIPARAGSKGVPGKNLRRVAGLSLIGHAVRLARAFLRAHSIEGEILVDTDGQEIADEAARCGVPVPFMRKPALAGDATPTIDVTLDALDQYASRGKTFERVMLLQPTSPLRALVDASACYQAHLTTGSALTVSVPAHPPHRALQSLPDGTLQSIFPAEIATARRQDMPAVVEPNGAVYVNTVEFHRTHKGFFHAGTTRGVLMPAERSIDIDTELDFVIAEAIASHTTIDLSPLKPFRRTTPSAKPLSIVAVSDVRQLEVVNVTADAVLVRSAKSSGETHFALIQDGKVIEGQGPVVLHTRAGMELETASTVDTMRSNGAHPIVLVEGAEGLPAMRALTSCPTGALVSTARDMLHALVLGAHFVVVPFSADHSHLSLLALNQ